MQSGKHSPNVFGLAQSGRDRPPWRQPYPFGQHKESFQFRCRAPRYADKIGIILPCSSHMAFGDIRGDRNCCPDHLRREAVFLPRGERFRQFVDRLRQVHRACPYL